MPTVHRVRPTIGLKKTNVPKLVTGSKVIQGNFVLHAALLANPPITTATFLSQINDVDTANQVMKTNKNAGPARQVKVDILWGTLETLCVFVKQLCDAHPDQASAYIAASGFKESAVGDRHEDVLTAEATSVPGQVHLKITSSLLETPKNKKNAKRTHLIRHTLDAGKTYLMDEATSNAHALISGLPVLTPIGFEVAAKDSSGTSAWSAAVPITLLSEGCSTAGGLTTMPLTLSLDMQSAPCGKGALRAPHRRHSTTARAGSLCAHSPCASARC